MGYAETIAGLERLSDEELHRAAVAFVGRMSDEERGALSTYLYVERPEEERTEAFDRVETVLIEAGLLFDDRSEWLAESLALREEHDAELRSIRREQLLCAYESALRRLRRADINILALAGTLPRRTKNR